MNKPERYRIYLYNKETKERQPALAKHAEMCSKREAINIIKSSKESMPYPWEYRKERIQ